MSAYEVSESGNSLAIAFMPELDLVSKAVADAQGFIARKAAPIDVFSFKLALFESLENAVKHGSKANPSSKVELALELKPSCLAITVLDGGEGFDWRRQMEEEETPADIDKPSGRGIFLLKCYNCNPTYNEKGNALSLRIDFT